MHSTLMHDAKQRLGIVDATNYPQLLDEPTIPDITTRMHFAVHYQGCTKGYIVIQSEDRKRCVLAVPVSMWVQAADFCDEALELGYRINLFDRPLAIEEAAGRSPDYVIPDSARTAYQSQESVWTSTLEKRDTQASTSHWRPSSNCHGHRATSFAAPATATGYMSIGYLTDQLRRLRKSKRLKHLQEQSKRLFVGTWQQSREPIGQAKMKMSSTDWLTRQAN